MTAADRVKELCKEKGIAVYQLEKDLGFANAYISRIKKDSLPYESNPICPKSPQSPKIQQILILRGKQAVL